MRVRPPWNEDIVEKLEEWQETMHPYTCAVHTQLPLVPGRDGWWCTQCKRIVQAHYKGA